MPMLNEKVKTPNNNTFHIAPVKTLFLSPCSVDEIFSLISLLDNKKRQERMTLIQNLFAK